MAGKAQPRSFQPRSLRHDLGAGRFKPRRIAFIVLNLGSTTPCSERATEFSETSLGQPIVSAIRERRERHEPRGALASREVGILLTSPGFVGQDQFTYDVPADPLVFNWLGSAAGPKTVIVTVGTPSPSSPPVTPLPRPPRPRRPPRQARRPPRRTGEHL